MTDADVRGQLEAWYRQRAGLEDATVATLNAPASGVVNETWLHTVHYRRGGEEVSLPAVVRIQPATADTPIPDVNVLEQAFVLRKLCAVGGLLTPRVYWEEPDSRWLGRPFYVMQRLEGEPVFDAGKAPDDAAALRSMYEQTVEMLARIHAVDWEGAGLAPIRRGSAAQGPLGAGLAAYRAHLDAASHDKRYPLLEAAYHWLADNLPEESAPVLNWGDARVGNLLFSGDRLTAVLDWEIAEITAREVDVGWFVFFERFLDAMAEGSRPGAMSTQEIVAVYERHAGTALRDLDWFQRWAAFRLAIMRLRAHRADIKYGRATPESRVDEINYGSIELARVFGFPEPQ